VKRLERLLTLGTGLGWKRRAGAIQVRVPAAHGPISHTDVSPLAGLSRSWWLKGTLVVLLILLSPRGGPCERRSRVADPTTFGWKLTHETEHERQQGMHEPEGDAGLPGTCLDILDDEGSDDEFDSGDVCAGAMETVPPAARALGTLVTRLFQDGSGSSNRTSVLRC
jgi:hypothetical protein